MKRLLLIFGTALPLLIALARAPLAAEEAFQEIVVNPGDTLWSISNRYLKDPRRWPDIIKHNTLPTSDPTIALPGSKIKVPVMLIKEEYQNAELVMSIPEVRYRRKGEKDWQEAKAAMTLKYEDSLRTMKGAQARVRFPTKEIVQINENSYVVLRPEKILQEIQLFQGDVRASRARVIMPSGVVIKPKGDKSDYHARVRENETGVVFVYKGQVDVTAQGKTVTVREGFGTEIPQFSIPQTPLPLSNFADFNPAEMTVDISEPKIDPSKGVVTVAPPKEKPLEKPNGSKSVMADNLLSHYQIQLSKDERFKEMVLEKTEPIGKTFNIKQQRIPDGTYFMRMAFVDALGVTGKFSTPTTIVKDSEAPKIENLTPEEGQRFYGEEAYCDVIGVVEGATMVAVNDEVVFLSPTGRFNKFITLKEGENKIMVVARDPYGNQSSVERKVHYSKKR